MNKIIINTKIKGLKLYYNWYGFLFAITNKKSFFDKKIKIGILILSFISILASCNEQKTETKKNITKPKICKNNDTTFVEKIELNSDTIKPNKNNTIKFQPSCYISPDIEEDLIQVQCYQETKRSIEDTNTSIIEDNDSTIYESYLVEQQPEFPNGVGKFYETIQNLLVYPKEALDNKIEGKVFISIIIEKDGSLSNFKILRGIPELNNEAIRVLKLLPNFIPGKQKGKEVRVKYVFPIVFKLPE